MRTRLVASVALMLSLAAPADAQWLNQPTPNIPRTADGKPNLTAATLRTADGRPDLSGVWTNRGIAFAPPESTLTPAARALVREREENYFKDRPVYQCRPTGPEVKAGWKRIVQTPELIAILYEDLTYRMIWLDGRALEPDPARMWMGYSVGRWEGDTLVVDSFGFNDRSWLDARGLPHSEALRLTERYTRSTVGRIQVEVTATDPAMLITPAKASYAMELRADTEMLETVCEGGRQSEIEQGAVAVPAETLAKYVGTYSGLWGGTPRTVRITLVDGTLYANGLIGDTVRLVPHSDTFFMGSDGLQFMFGVEGDAVTYLIERHVSGDWQYARQ